MVHLMLHLRAQLHTRKAAFVLHEGFSVVKIVLIPANFASKKGRQKHHSVFAKSVAMKVHCKIV